MARHRVVLGVGERGLDRLRPFVRPRVGVGRLSSAPDRRLGVGLDDPERVEAHRQRLAELVDRAQRARHLGPHRGLAQLARLHPAALDEHGHDRLGLGEHRRNPGRDADAGRALVRDPLGLAVDLEHRRVLAGHADHVVAGAETGAEIAVRDPAPERLPDRPPVRPRSGQAARRSGAADLAAVDVRPGPGLGPHRSCVGNAHLLPEQPAEGGPFHRTGGHEIG